MLSRTERHGRRFAVDEHPPGGGLLQVGEDPQDRGLAAAGRTDQGREAARGDVDVGRLDGGDLVAPEGEHLADPANVQPVADDRRGRRVVDHHDCDLPFS
jgi:hypothetical protein